MVVMLVTMVLELGFGELWQHIDDAASMLPAAYWCTGVVLVLHGSVLRSVIAQ